MSNANRDYAIVYDVKNSSLVLSRPLKFYITDKNTSNIFVKLVTRIIAGNGIDQYTDIENASNYVLTMRVIKPNNKVESIEATQHEPENIFQFDLTEEFKDIPGKYTCELTISTIVSGRQELITSDPFNYEVKRSILSNVDDFIETEDTTTEKILNDLNMAKAELTDARVGANGVTYNNVGNAIRTQINMIAGHITASNTLTIGDDFSGDILGVDISASKGQTIEIKVSCDSSILADTSNIPVAIVKTDNEIINELYEITPNKLYRFKLDYNIKQLKVWIGHKSANGDVTLNVLTESIYDYANEINDNLLKITGDITTSNKLTITDNFSGGILGVNVSTFKSQIVEVKVSCDSSVLASDCKIPIGIRTTNDEIINELYEIAPNKLYRLKFDYNAKEIRAWIGHKSANGDVTLTATAKDIYESVNGIDNRLSRITGDTTTSNTLTIEDGFSGDIISLGISALKGQAIEVKVSCDSSILADGYKIPIGIVTTDNETINGIAEITPNKLYKLKFDYNIKDIKFWIGGKSANGDVIATVTVKNIYDSIYELDNKVYELDNKVYELDNKVSKLNHLQGLTFSVLGDSYSSYKGWIPQDNEYWYADEGNSTPENDVASVVDTWWYKLSKDTGMSLLINDSYSGSTVSTTGYSGGDATWNSFTTRMVNTLGEKRVLEPKPNIIFIFGGTNDSWADSPIGELKYSDWITDDLKNFLPAFCYTLAYIKKYNPQARIINIINTELKSEITNGMVSACEYYNIECIRPSIISKTGGHPNKLGMTQIKDAILSIL